MDDLISKQDALELVKDVCDAIMSCCGSHYDEETEDEVYDDIHEVATILKCNKEIRIALKNMPSSQPEEVIPHRNYKYLSDYWCECGWHLGKKGEVKYCADCGRKVNWDG